MITATIQNKDYLLPQTWNELTNEQLCFLHETVQNETTVQEVKTKILFFCLGISYDFRGNMRLDKKKCPLLTEDIYIASQTFNFLFREEENKHYLNIGLTRCPFPTTKELPNIENMLGGGDALTDITYGQFIYLLSFDQIRRENEKAKFDFLTCLFRPKDKEFDVEKVDPKQFEKLSAQQIQLLEWYWIGSLEFLADKFPRTFSDGDNNHTSTSIYDSQERLLDMVCDGDIVRKQASKREKLYNVLSTIEYLLEKRENEVQPH